MRRELGETADQTYFDVVRVEQNFWTPETAKILEFPGLVEEGKRLLVAEGVNAVGQIVQAIVIEDVDDGLFYRDLGYKKRVARIACEIFGLNHTLKTSSLLEYLRKVQSPGQVKT
jgi:hypothetical protein